MLTVSRNVFVVLAGTCLVLYFVLQFMLNDKVDVTTLTVRELKELLELRGTNYKGFVEKTDLISLVNKSAVTVRELAVLREAVNSAAAATDTIFVSGIDYKTTAENKDVTPWLVAIIVNGTFPMSVNEWQILRKKLAKLGVRTGVLDCQKDPKFCQSRKWKSSSVRINWLSVKNKNPEGLGPNDPAMTEKGVFRWVLENLQSNLRLVGTSKLSELWPSSRYISLGGEKLFILFTDQQSPPPFYTAVAARLAGEVQFHWVKVISHQELLDRTTRSHLHGPLSKVLRSRQKNVFPLLLYLSHGGVYQYTGEGEECLSFFCLRNFLTKDPHSVSMSPGVQLLYGVWMLMAVAVTVFVAWGIAAVFGGKQQGLPDRPNFNFAVVPDGHGNMRLITTEEANQLIIRVQLESQQERNPSPVHDSTELPKWSYSKHKRPPDGYRQEADDIQCSICTEEYKERDRMSGLPCQHVFHYRCLVKWLKVAPSNTCPLCRQ